MKRKLLIVILAVLSCFACAFAFTACGGSTDGNETPKVVEVTGVYLDNSSLSLEAGQTRRLNFTVTPGNATDKTVYWRSSNTTVATVSNGVVTAKKAGTATITATAGYEDAICKVTVTEKSISVDSVSLNKTFLTLEVGGTEMLTATVLPSNATDKTVSWRISDPSVVMVINGEVTAKKAGTTTITAIAGSKSATCEVTVIEKVIEVTAIYLDKNSVTIKTEESETLVATVRPANASDKTVIWESSNTSVASVSENGTVTGISEGNARIFATSSNGIEAMCEVTVVENTYGYVFAEYSGGYTVVGYNGTDTILNIPSSFRGSPVVAIGNITDTEAQDNNYPLSETAKTERGGFYYNNIIEKIILADTITDVNAYAFSNCNNLKEVILNEGLTHIGFKAFAMAGVKELKIPSTLDYIFCGLFGSSIETLEFAKVQHSHFTKYFGYYKDASILLDVPSVCYYRGEIDSHFEVTSYGSKRVYTGVSTPGVITGSLDLEYPSSYKLINRWFTTPNGDKCYLYGNYEITTRQVKVTTEWDASLYVYYNCPSQITGNFYIFPATLKKVVINDSEYDSSFVEDLNIEFVNNYAM